MKVYAMSLITIAVKMIRQYLFLIKNRIIAEKQGTVHVLEPAKGTSRFNDHAFLSRTNKKPLVARLDDFINQPEEVIDEN